MTAPDHAAGRTEAGSDQARPAEAGVLELWPGRLRVAGWSLLAALLVAMVVRIVVDTSGGPVALVALVVAVLLAAFFVSQLLLPGLHAVALTESGLSARTLWRTVEVAWTDVAVVRVRRRFGEPWLSLEVRGRSDPVPVMLPIGTDLTLLHAWLEMRLERLPDR